MARPRTTNPDARKIDCSTWEHAKNMASNVGKINDSRVKNRQIALLCKTLIAAMRGKA